jgi:hypothetical protein
LVVRSSTANLPGASGSRSPAHYVPEAGNRVMAIIGVAGLLEALAA